MNNRPSPSLQGNILIVDDVPNNLQLLAQMLSEKGYKTRTAPDGQLALRSIDFTPPDLILLDIMMPGMDGYKVCQALKASAKTKDIPVIFISALNEVFDKVKAFEVGGVDYITKPFHEAEVLARVSNQILGRQLFEQIQQQNLRLESEIVDRKQAQEETDFLLATTLALAQSDDFEESIAVILRSCCEFIDWDLGEAWIPNDDETFLACSRAFYAKDPSLLEYINQSLPLTFTRNIGLPGRIWSSQESEWLEDISQQPYQVFPRHKIAAAVGLKAGFGLPILVNNRVVAILTFFKKTALCSQPRLIQLINSIATQLGSFIQRKQAEARLKLQFQKERLLNQLTLSIRSSLNLTTILTTAVGEIATNLGVEYVAFLQYFSEQKLWSNISEYRQNDNLQISLEREIADENNQIADRLLHSETVQIEEMNIGCDSNKCFAQICPGAWLLVPLKVDSMVWGTLCAVKENSSYRWQVFEVELLRAVADSVAIAIKKAELYQESQSYAQQLEAALSELKSTQAQLVQNANMASLGQLIAGIAHEINNPTNFIYGNVSSATEYARELLNLSQLYQHHYPEPVAEIAHQLEAIDIDFIAEDYPKLMNSIKKGATRIKQIVLSLRNFSRLGEKEYKTVDIHEGIDNSLVILQHRLRGTNNEDGIEIIKNYSELPKISCYASLLNQVFVNLIANAIDAVENQPSPRRIAISTKESVFESRSHSIPSVAIHIADNGCGMSDDVRDRIFDPFFSTKPVGSGTGLGLAICHNIIVEKHGGQISCISTPAEGTEFIVQIPI